MIPGEDKAEVSLSSEFFKKLNQQIVQKDNLIKLLQLQIKSLKSQLEENTSDGKKKDDLAKVLENKENEIKNLESELANQRALLVRMQQEKDEQIQSLNQLLAEQKKALETSKPIPVEDPRIPELEATIARLEEELEAAQKALSRAEEAGPLKQQLAELTTQLNTLESEMQARDQEIIQLQNEVAAKSAELADLQGRSAGLSSEAQTRIAELEQDVATLKGLLDEKDQQLNAFQNSSGGDGGNVAELQTMQSECDQLRTECDQLRKQISELEALAAQAAQYKQAAEEVTVLKARIGQLENDAAGFTEVSMKLTALEEERNHLATELEQMRKRSLEQSAEMASLLKAINESKEQIAARDQEIQQLRRSHEELMSKVEEPSGSRVEVEALTNQVADQLLAIQRLQEVLREHQEQLSQKDKEINELNMRLAASVDPETPIRITNESSDIVASFIDFFDELDAMLTQAPNPQLQALHKKLLDRLIVPNEIQYQPVISEQYDPTRHIATDYFRSDRFPERCIVFEVEKGYRRGDHMVKKSKVWVVQNLFNCQSCGVMQADAESRFCHKCGEKILAPNGLPVDSLPDFQPTPNTYLRFAEAMFEKKKLDKAREYLTEGLKLDPSFVPLLVKMADVHAHCSEFAEAIEVLKKAYLIKPDPKIQEQINALNVRKTIFEQARNLNLPPEEFEKLMGLLQQKN